MSRKYILSKESTVITAINEAVNWAKEVKKHGLYKVRMLKVYNILINIVYAYFLF